MGKSKRFRLLRFIHNEPRSLERIKAHYEVEKELAARLRAAGRKERRVLYMQVYKELLRRVPDHPSLMVKGRKEYQQKANRNNMRMVQRFLSKDIVFLEIGPGDGSFALEVAKRVREVYAADIRVDRLKSLPLPENVHAVLSDGASVPVVPETVDVAYSNQVMEHAHPDDAAEQLSNIRNALKPGGVYLCRTPNALSGPHDVSMYFDEVATCFHLKEYTFTELRDLFARAGFRKMRAILGARGLYLPFTVPLFPLLLLEKLLRALPRAIGRALSHTLPMRVLLLIQIIARK
jgi:SAM-dependent methyltransferase